jgi:hypothetical protein
MKRAWLVGVSLLLPLATASCTQFNFVGMELHARYDGKADKLVLLEIEHGICAGGSSSVAEGTDAFEKVALGRRLFPPNGGLAVDVDELERKLAAGELISEKPAARHVAELAHDLKIEKCGMFLDEEGRLSLFRVWDIAHFKSLLAVTNEAINDDIAAEVDDKEGFKPRFAVYDTETRDLRRARSKARASWLSTDGDAIVLDAPMTPKCAARCLSDLLKDACKPDNSYMASFYSQLSSLEIKDKHVVLRFAPGPDEWLRFEWKWPEEHYAPDILNQLKEHRSFLDESATLKQIRGTMKQR